jgi:hypothetical protein
MVTGGYQKAALAGSSTISKGTFFWISSQRDSKKCKDHQRSFKKYCFDF